MLLDSLLGRVLLVGQRVDTLNNSTVPMLPYLPPRLLSCPAFVFYVSRGLDVKTFFSLLFLLVVVVRTYSVFSF